MARSRSSPDRTHSRVDSLKGRLLEADVTVSLVAQNETPPYAYVSVEGVVTAVEPVTGEADTRAMARRYLGDEMGDAYTEATKGQTSVRVRIRPERWLTVDYAKASPI